LDWIIHQSLRVETINLGSSLRFTGAHFYQGRWIIVYEPSRPSPSGAAIYVDLIERTW
jgi:hypothetical protein